MSRPWSTLARQYWEEVWNAKDVSRLDRYCAPDLVLHIGGMSIPGEALPSILQNQWFASFPDLHVQIDMQIEQQEHLVESLVFSGTHSGTPFLPGIFRAVGLPAIPAQGRAFEFTQISICRFDGERIAEIWEDFDRLRLFMQLGVTLNVPAARE